MNEAELGAKNKIVLPERRGCKRKRWQAGFPGCPRFRLDLAYIFGYGAYDRGRSTRLRERQDNGGIMTLDWPPVLCRPSATISDG